MTPGARNEVDPHGAINPQALGRSRRGHPLGVATDYTSVKGEQYAQWQLKWEDIWASEVARRFREWASPDLTVVDFGCGGGAILAALPAARRIGIEPNAAAAAVAVSRGLEVASTTNDIDDASVDLAISNHALEHVLNPVAELTDLRRIMKVGGRLVIVVPFDDWRAQRGVREDVNHHLYTWTPLLMRNLLIAAGFVVDSVELVHHAYPPASRLLWQVLPRRAFDLVAALASRVQRRVQVKAVAHRDVL